MSVIAKGSELNLGVTATSTSAPLGSIQTQAEILKNGNAI